MRVFSLVLTGAAFLLGHNLFAQEKGSNLVVPADSQKAEAILQKAIQNLGGDKYLQVKTQIGRGSTVLFATAR